jgi:hypothetical protein
VRALCGVAAAVVALSGCGGSAGGGHVAATPASHSVSPNAAASSPEAGRSPAQIIADAQAALNHVHSFHIEVTGRESGRRTSLSADIQVPGRLSAVLTQGAGVARVVLIGDAAYFNANAPFLLAQGNVHRDVVPLLANRWLRVPNSPSLGFGSLLASTEPGLVGPCTIGPHLGTIVAKGRGTVNGRPVIILADKGDAPGSSPGLIYLSASGPPLELKAVQTGPQKPGGTPSARCHETEDDVTSSGTDEVGTISEYNTAPAVTAPPTAINPGALGGGAAV